MSSSKKSEGIIMMLLKIVVAMERFEVLNARSTPSELTRGFLMCAFFLSI